MNHKPLLGILNNKAFAEVDMLRLQQLKEKLLQCTFKMLWRQEVKHKAFNIFSGHPVSTPIEWEQEDKKKVDDNAKKFTTSWTSRSMSSRE